MCGIGLLLSFSENNADLTTSDDDNSTSATDDHANEIQTREFIIECNQGLSEALTARGPDVPRRQCYFVGDSSSCVSGEDGIIRPISQVVSTQNNYDGSNNNWSLTLHASVLHMRGESAMAQPVLFQSLMENGSGVDAGRNEHETMRKLNKNSMESADGGCNSMHANCALCWNGECYTYQQNSAGANDDAQQERKNQDSNFNRNTNVLDGTMVELISSTSTSTSKTEHSRSQSSVLKMTADSDTMLVKNILLNAIADSRGFYSTYTHDKRQRNSNSNIDDSQSTLREHEAIVNAMSRIHGEFSFILFVPSLSPGLYSSQNSSMSGSTMTDESHANHHASSPGYVYYGRDCLGRRSLLINKSTKGTVVLSSVAIEGTTTNNNIDIDGDGANTDRSANNNVAAKFHASWEEISPGIVYKMNVCTGEITSLYIPKIVNKEVDALASAVGEHTTIFPKGYLIHESIEQSNHEHAANGLLRLLDRAVQRRVMHAPTPNSNSTNDASVAVLFSGGIDSVVLAALSHRHVPLLQPIDLINVSFYSGAESASSSDGRRDSIPPSPDRLAAILSFREMQRRWPKRNWRFIAVDVSYQEVLQYEAHILRLISPLDSTMDFNIAVAFWFAGRGSGRILEQDEAEERRNELESKGSKLGTDVATLSQEPLLRFAKQRMPGNTKGNNKNQSQKSSKKHVHCVRVGCPRSAAPSGCVFGTACSFCCGKLQSPISSFLGRSARMCPHHNHSNAGSSNKSPHKTFPKNVNVCSVAKSKGSGARDDRALCENTKSLGIRCNKVTSTAKILLSGVGADEQMAGEY